MWRDFTYIDDIVEGVVRVLDKEPQSDPTWDRTRPDPAGSSAPYRVYNIGNNSPVKLSAFIEKLQTALGKNAVKNYLPMQAGDVSATEADIEPLISQFDWKPDTELPTGLSKFVEWLRQF